MSAPRVLDLGDDRQLVDIDFRDTEGLVASYLLPGPVGWTLVETGPASCRAALLAGLARAGVAREEIRQVFVTHIHLDHAGGIGALANDLPRATFYAHELGVPHLVDPTKLVASARRAWGASADPLWGPIVPVASGRVEALRGGERFPLKDGELRVLATPGHAKHHLAFFDSRTRAVMTGDGAGVRLERSDRVRPAIPPPDLDLDQLFSSVEAMRRLQPRRVLYSHFGPSPDGAADLARYRGIVEAWRDVALAAARERPDIELIAQRLREFDLTAHGERPTGAAPTPDPSALVSGYDLAARGLLRYFETHGQIPREMG
jgi:glyoxylase-like metal-dependent hydrolase (beta-lactamase superfamily II)